MRISVAALVLAAVSCCVGLACAASQVQVVGTLTAMETQQAEGSGAGTVVKLRVDSVEAKDGGLAVGQTLVVTGGPGQIARRIGLGDQVKAALEPGAGATGEWKLTADLEYLGRGEFMNPAEKATTDLGSPEAKVLVKLFAPLGIACHQKTVDLLKKLGADESKRVRVQFFDMQDPAGRDEINRERLTCATVLVNNRTDFTLKLDGEERKVSLTHRPNAEKSTYNSEDVPLVVQQEIARLYPLKAE